MASKDAVAALVGGLVNSLPSLPETIPLATKTDKIFQIMTTVSGDTPWETLNRRFDILFGEDCRDAEGRLLHVRRGPHGLDLICQYLQEFLGSTAPEEVPFESLEVKVRRLSEEVRILGKKQTEPAQGSVMTNSKSSGLKLRIPRPNPALARPGTSNVQPGVVPGRTASIAAVVEAENTSVSNAGYSTLDQEAQQNMSKAGDSEMGTPKTAKPKVAARATAKVKQSALDIFLKGPLCNIIQLLGDDEEDKSYKPPRQPRAASVDSDHSPERIFDSDGNEIVDDTVTPKIRPKRKAAVVIDDSSASEPDEAETPQTRRARSRTRNCTSSGKYKRPARPKKKGKHHEKPEVLVVTSSEESDGQGALRKVEDNEAARSSKLKRGPVNSSLRHWHGPVPIRDRKTGPRWQFKCRYCSATRTVKRTVGGDDPHFKDEPRQPALANLASHLREDHPDALKGDKPAEDGNTAVDHGYTLASAKLMAQFLAEGELNPAVVPTQKGFYRVFAAWILDEDLPFTTGESLSLARLFKYLKIKFVLPSDTTVRNVLAQIFIDMHAKVVREFTRVKSKIAYSTDTWTTRQMVFTFAGTLAHFIDDDWTLIERLVDFYHIQDDEHQGREGARAFVKSAAKRGGLDKFISITMDNASANDVLARTVSLLLLKRYGIHFNPENGRIRCIAHVINLVVQKILHTLNEADDPALADYYELWNKHLPFHYDPDADDSANNHSAEPPRAATQHEGNGGNTSCHPVGTASGPDSESEMGTDDEDDIILLGLGDDNSWEGKSALQKLRLIVNKVVSSPQRRSTFRKVAAEVYSAQTPENARRRQLMVIRDVPTRWNYTHAMIERGILLREAIDTWIFKTRELRTLLLGESEWATLQQLCDILKIFTKVTKEMSRANQPTLPFVLPLYEQMRHSLEEYARDELLAPPFRNAAAAGLAKLNQYYSEAKSSQYTIIATVLHPSLRVKWFNKLGNDFVPRAEALFKHAFEGYTASFPRKDPVPTPPSESVSNSKDDDFLLEVIGPMEGSPASSQATSVSAPDHAQADAESELDRYLAGEGGPGQLRMPLTWWKENACRFPIIARMARDFLAIPATSVSVERLFSSSRHLCTDVRASFKARTVTEAMCVKHWIRAGLLDIDARPPEPRCTTSVHAAA